VRVLAQELKAPPTAHILIAGNTDAVRHRGVQPRRAAVARAYLLALGIFAERLDSVTDGERGPAGPGHDAAARAKNRRDEVSSR